MIMRWTAPLALLLAACSSEQVEPAAKQLVTVTIEPREARVTTGGTQAFTGTVSGASDSTIFWSVREPGGGSIDASGLYTAPGSPGLFSVVATSVADPTRSAVALVAVIEPQPDVAISIDPTSARVGVGQIQGFTATVTGTDDLSVTWSVREQGGGTIDATGLYTAPATPGTYTVEVRSNADPSKVATATVEVDPAPQIVVRVSPRQAQLMTGDTQQFAATVENATDETVTWSVREAGGGSVGETGLYTAPDAAGTYHVVAASRQDPTRQDAATVTVEAPPEVTVTVLPATAQVQTGGTRQFTATVENAEDTSVVWSVEEAGGGTVSETGLYTAPGTPGTYHVIATSNADSSRSGGATVVVDTPGAIDLSILPEDRRTRWEPGIPGGIPVADVVHTTIDAAMYGNGTTDATGAINDAVQAAGDEAAASGTLQVVYLPEGTYRLTDSVYLDRSGVVLRGAGPGRTTLHVSGNNRVVWMGQFYPPYPDPVDVVGSVARGSRTITVASASGIRVGDVLQIDQLEDGDRLGNEGFVWRYDIDWSMRGPRPEDVNGPSSPDGYRPIGQQVEVAAKDGNTLTLANTIHIAFPEAQSPQVFHTGSARNGMPGTRRVGLEDLTLQGGTDAQVEILNCAYSWVSNVESDGRFGGSVTHISMSHGYRNVIRDSYIHHATNYDQGGNAYGIKVGMQSTDNLIENNIVIFLNKPVVSEASGGGNVFGYNYVDEAVNGSLNGTWQESALDGSHGAFCFYDLYEGNLAPNVGTDTTHGNNGWITFFRNRATGRNTSARTTGNVRAVGIDGWNLEHTSIGNVLLMDNLRVNGTASVLFSTPSNPELEGAAVYRLGANAWDKQTEEIAYDIWDDGQAERLFHRHLDWDFVTKKLFDNPENPVKTLPRSLYLTAKPAFFADHEWPWIDPTGATEAERVKVLPARARYDALAR